MSRAVGPPVESEIAAASRTAACRPLNHARPSRCGAVHECPQGTEGSATGRQASEKPPPLSFAAVDARLHGEDSDGCAPARRGLGSPRFGQACNARAHGEGGGGSRRTPIGAQAVRQGGPAGGRAPSPAGRPRRQGPPSPTHPSAAPPGPGRLGISLPVLWARAAVHHQPAPPCLVWLPLPASPRCSVLPARAAEYYH